MWNKISNIRRGAFLLTIAVLISVFTVFGEPDNTLTPTPAETAKKDPFPSLSEVSGAIFYHVESGTVMHEKDADKKTAPSITARMMVALIAIEKLSGRLEEQVTIPSAVMQNAIGTHMELKTGEVIAIGELINGLIIANANDAAYMLALLCAENSIDNFVMMMNQKAAELGMNDTKYVNITGVDNPDAYTTPRDVLTLTMALYDNEHYRSISSLPKYTVPATNKKKERVLHTKNYMLSKLTYPDYFYSNANGLCAGSTGESGNTLCATAEINNAHFVAIAMNATGNYKTGFKSFIAAREMFDYLPDSYGYRTVITKGTIISEIKVELAEEYDYVTIVPKESFSKYLPLALDLVSSTQFDIELFETTLTAPVDESQEVGVVHVILNGEMLVSIPLVTMRGLTLSRSDQFTSSAIAFFTSRTVVTVILVICGVCILSILIYARYRYCKTKKVKIKSQVNND